jgi:LysM repeat protein
MGKMLGIGRQPEPEPEPEPEHVHASEPSGRQAIPLETRTPDAMPRPLAPGTSSAALDSGGFLEALADGEPVVVGPIHSPWPRPGTEVEAGAKAEPKAKSDEEVSRASGDQADATAAPKHVVAKGDTFEGLARKYYGDGRYSRALWWANRDRVAWPDALAEGKSLVVPGLGELEPRMVLAGPIHVALPDLEPAGPRRDPQAVRASYTEERPAPGSTDSGGVAVHVVRPEDTLRIIAREKCGDERKALEIIALNRDALSKDGRPRVGQCLILPPPAEKR